MYVASPRVSFFKNASQAFSRTTTSRKACVVVKAEKMTDSVPSKWTLEAFTKPVTLTTLSSLVLALPAFASEEPGKLFDFNLTLPVMAVQFLILMVFLDKTWFTPVGELLDRRDKVIRDQLANVGSKASEIARLEKEAEEILKKARMEAQAEINKARMEEEAKAAAAYNETKAKVDAEIEAAFRSLEDEKAAAMKGLESQVDTLAAQIMTRILPEGVSV